MGDHFRGEKGFGVPLANERTVIGGVMTHGVLERFAVRVDFPRLNRSLELRLARELPRASARTPAEMSMPNVGQMKSCR